MSATIYSFLRVALCTLLLLPLTSSLSRSQNDVWDTRFTSFSVDGRVRALVRHGHDVFVAGDFQHAAGLLVNHIARWNDVTRTWSPLGNGLDGSVRALAMDADGNLYAGGLFSAAGTALSNGVAKWDGTEWHSLAEGISGGSSLVATIALDGSDLYIGGNFTAAGGVPTANIARWNGSAWSPLGEGIGGTAPSVAALAAKDGKIYVGGRFEQAGTETAHGLALWDGTKWSAIEGTISGGDAFVSSLTLLDDALYVGGSFATIDDLTVNNVAKRDIAQGKWEALNNGVTGTVSVLMPDDGVVYVGGEYTIAELDPVVNLAIWNGTKWTAREGNGVGGGIGVFALAADTGDLFVGGEIAYAGTKAVLNLGRWSKTTEKWLSPGPTTTGAVNAIASIDNEVYVAGEFATVDGLLTRGITMWDGLEWHDLAGGATGPVDAIEIDGDDVYIGGAFNVVGGNGNNTAVSRWNRPTQKWLPLKIGVLGRVFALAKSDTSLYIAGRFTVDDSVKNLARWDGTNWNKVGGGVDGTIYAIVVTENGLYIGGEFTSVGGTTANNLAYWDGSAWHTEMGIDGTVNTLAVAPNGDLYVGGEFTAPDPLDSRNILRWSDGNWSALDEGADGIVYVLRLYNGDLYVGGEFRTVGTVKAAGIAQWNIANAEWSAVSTGVGGAFQTSVRGIDIFDGDLYIGGEFPMAGGVQSWNIARYGKYISDVDQPSDEHTVRAGLSGYPNPSDGEVHLSVALPEPGFVTLRIYTATGTEVARPIDGALEAGRHNIIWNPADLPNGTYFAQLTANNEIKTTQLTILH